MRHARVCAISLLLVTAAHGWLLAPLQLARVAPSAAALDVSMVTIAPVVRPGPLPKPAPKPGRARAVSANAEPALTLAPSLFASYRLRTNAQDGEASLRWERDGNGYQLRLDRRVGERALPGWRSEGRIGTGGLMPLRYAEMRGEKDARATNFRREEGLLSYSSSSEVLPLPEGVQDHLSWWLQLAALAVPEHDILLTVAGTRGEPQAWRFEWLGREEGLWHYRRASQAEWDGTLDIWLDPKQHCLPVRLQSGDPEQRGWRLEHVETPHP